MIISKAIFSVDDNPTFSGLWPIVSEICKKKLGITPVLFHITDDETDFYEDEYGIVKKLKKLENHNTGYQSQIIRMWGTKYFSEEVCLISDIDMIMFNKEYFVEQISGFSNDDLIIYCSDAYDTSRPECVGIYSNRYVMSYNAATGKNFDSILGTACTFQEYADKLSSFGFPTYDTDEMYYTKCVNNLNHGVNVVKLIRGFYSKFQVPRRIDRITDDEFNIYDDEKIYNNYYVDCHLARPFEKYRNQILDLKNKILKKKEVYLIGCHIENDIQLRNLAELVDRLSKEGKSYVLTSHTTIPESIVSKSTGFVYDSINPKYKTWDLPGKDKYEFHSQDFVIRSPYISYGRKEYYHVGVLRLLINGLNYIKNIDCDVIHWIEYDVLPDFEEDSENLKRLETFDFVFYGIGGKFSFLKESLNEELLCSSDKELLKLLSLNSYCAEIVIHKFLTNDKKTLFIKSDDTSNSNFINYRSGRYSNNNEIKLDWSLFEENDKVSIFFNNYETKKEIKIKLYDKDIDLSLDPGFWYLHPLSTKDNFKKIDILIDNSTILVQETIDHSTYQKLVGSVEKIDKNKN
jgi:hypothetical protein